MTTAQANIAGRKALFEYFDAHLELTDRTQAKFLKAVYLDDGETFVAVREGNAWRAFDPNEPRDEHGRWTAEGSGEGDHPGYGYSKDAYEDSQGVIHTDNVYDAARALSENRKVELNQVKEISTLIKHLGQVAKNMETLGEKAPMFNLCNVTIKGTNLFCVEAKDIKRVEMPVIPAKRTSDFIDHLKSLGYEVEKGKEKAANLRATQKELDGAKVAQQMKRIKKAGFYKRLVVSRDDYILDGHHTWAGELGLDAKDGNLYDDKEVKIARVNISITKLLEVANEWIKEEGIAKKPAGEKAVRSNPYHEPAGSSEGGQFAHAPGGDGGTIISGDGGGVIPGVKLTSDEVTAVEAWLNYEQFEEINYALRQGKKLDAEEKKLVADLSSAISKSKLDKPITLYRGFSTGEDNFGRNPGQGLLNKLNSMQIGDTYVDKGFTATSTGTAATDYGPAGTGSGAMMTIHAAAGTEALQMPAYQGEYVLQKGTRYTLIGKGKDEFIFKIGAQ